jgi:hypothetical protein
MTAAEFCYHGTDKPVLVGDRILVRRLLRRPLVATVVYVPGQTGNHPDIGPDQWAFRLDDGGIYVSAYSPEQFPATRRNIEFLCRASEPAAFHIPLEGDEPQGQPGRDLLAVIGCLTLIALAVLLLLTGWQKLFGAS